jgi:hypothetical protein
VHLELSPIPGGEDGERLLVATLGRGDQPDLVGSSLEVVPGAHAQLHPTFIGPSSLSPL